MPLKTPGGDGVQTTTGQPPDFRQGGLAQPDMTGAGRVRIHGVQLEWLNQPAGPEIREDLIQ